MITIRRITEADWSLFREVRLRALEEASYAFGATCEDALARSEDSWREQVNRSAQGGERSTLLAFRDEQCIGLAALYRNPPEEEAQLFQMWVDPSCRKSGVGSRLVQGLLDWGRSVGINSVVLGLTTENERAIAFYRSCGFELFEGPADECGFHMRQSLSK